MPIGGAFSMCLSHPLAGTFIRLSLLRPRPDIHFLVHGNYFIGGERASKQEVTGYSKKNCILVSWSMAVTPIAVPVLVPIALLVPVTKCMSV